MAKKKGFYISSQKTVFVDSPLLFVLKCKSCLKHFCSKCQSQENENIVKSGTCDQCDIKALRTLQEICRSNIRHTIKEAIGVARSSAGMLQSRDIDQNVQHLPLPGVVKNYVCYKWDLPSLYHSPAQLLIWIAGAKCKLAQIREKKEILLLAFVIAKKCKCFRFKYSRMVDTTVKLC